MSNHRGAVQIRMIDSATLSVRVPPIAVMRTKIKTLRGREWDKESGTWHVPLYHLRRLLIAFPSADLGDEKERIIEARLDMWRRWVHQHNAAGVWFSLAHDCKTVVPVGDGVSPAFAKWVLQHSDILINFLGDQVEPARRPSRVERIAEPTEADRRMFAAIQGGLAAEQRKAEMAERMRSQWRKKKFAQGSLLEDTE